MGRPRFWVGMLIVGIGAIALVGSLARGFIGEGFDRGGYGMRRYMAQNDPRYGAQVPSAPQAPALGRGNDQGSGQSSAGTAQGDQPGQSVAPANGPQGRFDRRGNRSEHGDRREAFGADRRFRHRGFGPFGLIAGLVGGAFRLLIAFVLIGFGFRLFRGRGGRRGPWNGPRGPWNGPQGGHGGPSHPQPQGPVDQGMTPGDRPSTGQTVHF